MNIDLENLISLVGIGLAVASGTGIWLYDCFYFKQTVNHNFNVFSDLIEKKRTSEGVKYVDDDVEFLRDFLQHKGKYRALTLRNKDLFIAYARKAGLLLDHVKIR